MTMLSPERSYELRGAAGKVLHRGPVDPTVRRGSLEFPPLVEPVWSLHFLDADGVQVGPTWLMPIGVAMLKAQRGKNTQTPT